MADRIDSRDLVERHGELADLDMLTETESIEYSRLAAVIEELRENCDEDPENGITMVPKDDWVAYVEELIDDCYGSIDKLLEGTGSNHESWPFRHLTFDYQAAADELESDYVEVQYPVDGTTYFCR